MHNYQDFQPNNEEERRWLRCITTYQTKIDESKRSW
jgi:hypothetical protein